MCDATHINSLRLNLVVAYIGLAHKSWGYIRTGRVFWNIEAVRRTQGEDIRRARESPAVTAVPRDPYYGQLAVYRIEDADENLAQVEAALQNAAKAKQVIWIGSVTARQRYGTGQFMETQRFWKFSPRYSLEPPATSPKKQEKNYQQQDEGEAATAVIAKARAHVITAAAEE
jgi:hypothetical protein